MDQQEEDNINGENAEEITMSIHHDLEKGNEQENNHYNEYNEYDG